MARRPTVRDVAREAGVSVATVDRALNDRLKVREETLRKIAEAARRVGYHGRALIDQKLETLAPERRFGFVLVKRAQEFYQQFAREIEVALAARTDIRGTAVIEYATSQSPDEFVEIMSTLGPKVDALACVAVNHQKLGQAVLDLRARGVPVFSMLNDFAQGIRRNYVGLNNIKIGRVAAWMLTRTLRQPGKLGIFVGGNRWHGHDLREVGFRSLVRDLAPAFNVMDTLVNLETRKVTYEATLDLLSRHADLRGIYVAGGGMEGAIAALREIRAPGEVALVVNELTAESAGALADGYVQMVISTPLDLLCRDLVGMMIELTLQRGDAVSAQHFLAPRIYLPEMI